MSIFSCQNCGQIVFFEDELCVRCGYQLGYLPRASVMLSTDRTGGWTDRKQARSGVRLCANAAFRACNWLCEDSDYCFACRHNRTIPDISDTIRLGRWRKLEVAKRYLFYGLMHLRLPIVNDLSFDFLDDIDTGILTGHEDGRITIALAEADDAERERRRAEMKEPYRTLVGHFRHEIGHYYWDHLVQACALDEFRTLFGDERLSYDAALQRYYEEGPLKAWQGSFVTAYATMHPWEDFAETWAQYLHIVDAMETASALHLRIEVPGLEAAIAFDPYRAESVEQLIAAWVPTSIALNMMNRSVGQPDVYPFILAEGVMPKLDFVHRLIVNNQVSDRSMDARIELEQT